jgi:cobalamin biosynthesis Mg chelatase CobN
MPKHEDGRIVETATEARQGEPGASVLYLLIISVGVALLAMGATWFMFFRT